MELKPLLTPEKMNKHTRWSEVQHDLLSVTGVWFSHDGGDDATTGNNHFLSLVWAKRPDYRCESTLKCVTSDKWTERRNIEIMMDTHCSHATLLTLVTSRTPWPGVRTPETHTCRRANHQQSRYRYTCSRTGCNFKRNHPRPCEGHAWRASNVSWLTPAESVHCACVRTVCPFCNCA